MRLRLALGALLGVAAVALAAPPSWMPWGGSVRALMPVWWALPVLASALLLAAAAALPGGPSGRPGDAGCWPTVHRAEAVALGLGLLLLLEPLLHLAVLAYLAHAAAPGELDLLLPGSAGAGPADLAVRIVVLCLLVPVAEEVFFRGRLLPVLAAHLGPWPALSLSSLAFAVAHGSPIACLVALPIGLLLGWLRLRHRDLGACVLVHQAHNGLFVLAGPALVTAPVSVAVLAIGGAVMLTLAAVHGRLGLRAVPAGLALTAALALAVPPMLELKDHWWADGTARVAARSRTEPGVLVARLDAQRRRGRLNEERLALLRSRLEDRGSDAARALRLWLDGADAVVGDPHDAEVDLLALARIAQPDPRLHAAALAIGLRWPGVLAAHAVEDPDVVAAWIEPDGAHRLLLIAEGRDRRLLLAALERAWPGRLATVLFTLPPPAVTALDRRHLRQHYPDAEALLEALDPARRAAWQ